MTLLRRGRRAQLGDTHHRIWDSLSRSDARATINLASTPSRLPSDHGATRNYVKPPRSLIEQFADLHSERIGEPIHELDRRVSRATFDVADVSAVDTGFVGQRFLAPAFGFVQGEPVGAEAVPNIHGLPQTCRSTIEPQTICYIDVGGRGGPTRRG
jgi:hypothetical protein